jgi:DNA polymerase-3 subunit delta'
MNSIFPSTLIIGDSTETINEILSLLGHKKILNNPDINLIDSEYSIEKIRDIKKFLSTKPYSHKNKIVIIPNADNLEIPAQNALLKILEDPGENNYLILTTNKPNSLLATILSRTHQIKIHSSTEKSTKKIVFPTGKLTDMNFGKDEILPFLEEQLTLHHQNLLDNPNSTAIIKTLLKSIDMINHNVDPFLALDYFLLN